MTNQSIERAAHLWPPTLKATIPQSALIFAQVTLNKERQFPQQQPAGIIAEFGYGPSQSDSNTWKWHPMFFNQYAQANNQRTAEYMIRFTPEESGRFDYLARF